jgi:hypothetical protein
MGVLFNLGNEIYLAPRAVEVMRTVQPVLAAVNDVLKRLIAPKADIKRNRSLSQVFVPHSCPSARRMYGLKNGLVVDVHNVKLFLSGNPHKRSISHFNVVLKSCIDRFKMTSMGRMSIFDVGYTSSSILKKSIAF